MTPREVAVLDAMEHFGGSFVSHLAKAWRYADPFNHQKLLRAFPEYWAEYEDLVVRREERDRKAKEDGE